MVLNRAYRSLEGLDFHARLSDACVRKRLLRLGVQFDNLRLVEALVLFQRHDKLHLAGFDLHLLPLRLGVLDHLLWVRERGHLAGTGEDLLDVVDPVRAEETVFDLD